ncbi:MAG: hypothetical protein P8Q90_03175 [Candidatus Thalassarchaeaceae archaeon]|nr:hypothetical protein [Candidatus Thalassarchaeaceae archaeon]
MYMFDDGSDELIGGAWPFLKRALIVFLPLWVYLIFWTATHQIFVSAIAAGFSVPLIQLFEKLKLKRKMDSEGR